MTQQKLPPGKQIAYAFGMMGWSIMINLISVILVYLFIPPENSGLPKLITQVAIFGVLNVIAIVTSSGRLLDVFYDLFIAQFSDQSKNPNGRRIPLMKKAILPSLVFCCLIFYPLTESESTLNIVWLFFTLIGFYVSSTTYIIPYNAMLPELAATSEDKVKLASWQSAGYVFGIGISSNAFNLTEYIQSHYHVDSKMHALQISIFTFALLAAIFMAITAFAIDEKKYCHSVPSSVPLKQALSQTLKNKNFLYFIVADFSYFISITLISSGLVFFVKVLLQLHESIGNRLMMTMVLVSFIFYPVTNWGAKKIGKKKIVIGSLILLAFIFLGIFMLGKFSVNKELQIYSLIALAAIPLASLNILPVAILSEVIEKDSRETNQNKEAIYFAVRYFFVKIAQTVGIGLFSMFLIYGKDVGNDFGIRLNGLLGFFLCLIAAAVFTKFREERKL